MNETIEAGARARGISVAALRAEAAEFARLRANKRASTSTAASRIALREQYGATTAKGADGHFRGPNSAQLLQRSQTGRQDPGAETEDLTPHLEAAFRRGGLSEAKAKIAAQGRGGRPASASLVEAGRELGLSPAAAKVFARGRGLREAVTDGSGFKATDYAYAPDLEDASTWKLLLVKQPGDGAQRAYDPDLVRAAATALAMPEWGAPQVDIPAADLPGVKQAVRGAWIQAGLPVAEIPPALDEAALAAAFQRGGLSPEKAAIAARGREGRR